MRLEFLGHGLHKDHTNTVGHYLIETFKNSDYDTFIGFSAFTKMSGLNSIKPELLFAKKNYKSIKFYLGIVRKGTSREALKFLIDNEIETYIFCTSDEIMFHPKIYYFEGKHNNRFILGSSNLTSYGLFHNIEASTFIEFSKNDQQGLKYTRQFNTYFSPILNSTDKNVEKLTNEVLKDLINSGFVWPESQTRDDFEFVKKNKNLFGKRKKFKLEKQNLGKIKPARTNKKYQSKYDIPQITEAYLKSWPKYFELFKEFKLENKHKGHRYGVTVPRDYKNPSLYNWYLKQKIYFKNDMLLPEHLKLLKEEKFYFGDAHKLWQEYKDDQKLKLIKKAIEDGEDIGLSQRYEYKGVRLGTWIQAVKKANKSGKKLDVRDKIEELGFDISSKSRNPIDTAKRFISDLYEDEDPNKMNWQNRFNHAVREKKKKLTPEIIKELEEVWILQFGEERSWEKIRDRDRDRTDEWKAFRYNKKVNPEEKWFAPISKMGDLYSWVRQKREIKSRMELVKDNFNEKEKSELRKEGFEI